MMSELPIDDLKANKALIRSWLNETLLPLAEIVADRVESNMPVDIEQANVPAVTKDMRKEAVEQLVDFNVVSEFEEDIQFSFKDADVALRMMQSSIKDLATISHIVRIVDAITDADPFNPSVCTAIDLDDFAEAKHKALLKHTTNVLLKFCVNNLQEMRDDGLDDDDEDAHSDDDEDKEDEEDDDAGVEKDSDESDESDEGSDSGEPDSEAEAKMVAEAEESDEEGESPAKRAKAQE